MSLKTTTDISPIFARYWWSWLGFPLAALQYTTLCIGPTSDLWMTSYICIYIVCQKPMKACRYRCSEWRQCVVVRELTRLMCRGNCILSQWRRQYFVTGEVRYGSIGGLEFEVPQSWLYCLCINVALRSTALQCIYRVIRRSSMTTKAHTY